MDLIVDFLASLFGEVLLQALAPILLALVWAVGAICLLYPVTHGVTPWIAGGLAFVCGAVLTYLWSLGWKAARNVLLLGSLLSLAPMVWLFVKSSS